MTRSSQASPFFSTIIIPLTIRLLAKAISRKLEHLSYIPKNTIWSDYFTTIPNRSKTSLCKSIGDIGPESLSIQVSRLNGNPFSVVPTTLPYYAVNPPSSFPTFSDENYRGCQSLRAAHDWCNSATSGLISDPQIGDASTQPFEEKASCLCYSSGT